MDTPPVIVSPARRPRSGARILVIVLGALGVSICLFAGWRQGVQRQHFQTLLGSLTPDKLAGITVTSRDSASSTNISDAASTAEFIAALRELNKYLPNHPQYRKEKEVSVAVRLQDGRELSFRACFSVDQQDRTAY